jgi:uncharacterized ion transporter superfamily protein YfcC
MNYYILFTLLVAISIASFVVLKIFRKKADYERTLNLTFLKITLPKKNSDLDEKKETTKDFKEMIGLMEQLFSSLKSVYSRKILRKIL